MRGKACSKHAGFAKRVISHAPWIGFCITHDDVVQPYGHYTFDLVIPCAPQNVDKLVAATYTDIARLQKEGPRPKEIQKEVEAQRRTAGKDEKDNSAWCWKLEMIYREGEPFTRLSDPNALIARVTAENLQRVAIKYIDTSKVIRFTMLPEKK